MGGSCARFNDLAGYPNFHPSSIIDDESIFDIQVYHSEAHQSVHPMHFKSAQIQLMYL